MNFTWKISLIIVALMSVITIFWYHNYSTTPSDVIKIGILHSLTGPMSTSEKPIVDAALIAIDEINKDGGLLNKKLVAVIADGASDWPTYAQQAEKLITQDHVAVIFGCWTSASRKAVEAVVKKYNSLLFYPVQYEGLEQSPNVVYTGSVPNQQAIPAVTWCLQTFGKRLFLVGSDYIFQRAVNAIITDLAHARDGIIVGEEYLAFTNPDIEPVIQKIIETKPDVIINTINGETNKAFFSALRKHGISSEKIPTMSLSITETELAQFNIDEMIGDYATQSYFQSLDTYKNKQFVKEFKKIYGKNAIISDPMENTYSGLYLWKNAAFRAKSINTDLVREQLSKEAFSSPGGIIYVDRKTQHTWKMVLIGKIFPNKQFGIIWNSVNTIKPIPYPDFRTKEQWEQLLAFWYQQWEGRWWKP